MELVNKTPVPASLIVVETEAPEYREGTITAKVTYRFDASGRVTLETEEPYPLFAEDQETKLGLLPRDDLPRRDDVFEVICLGSAHAPGGRAAEQMTVSLTVGDVTRRLLVTGDRTWQGERGSLGSTAPVPFIRMPLTWARAFGGRAEIQLDPDTTVDTQHLGNPDGRGWDPTPAAEALKGSMLCPDGYPRISGARPLPNVEDPDAAMTRWEDEPDPACWAAVPVATSIQALRSVRGPFDILGAPESMTGLDEQPEMPPTPTIRDGAYWRAAPGWILDAFPGGRNVILQGLTSGGRVVLQLPTPVVSADCVVGDSHSAVKLRAHMVVLLPDQQRFYIVLRANFRLRYVKGQERSARLSLASGEQGMGTGR